MTSAPESFAAAKPTAVAETPETTPLAVNIDIDTKTEEMP